MPHDDPNMSFFERFIADLESEHAKEVNILRNFFRSYVPREDEDDADDSFYAFRNPPPPSDAVPPCLRTLGISRTDVNNSLNEAELLRLCESRYRHLTRKYHPDRPGGSEERMAKINEAIAEARKVLGG